MQQAQPFNFRRWVKHGKHPAAALVRSVYQTKKSLQCPSIPGVHRLLYGLHLFACQVWHSLVQFWYFTPLFKSRLERAPKVLELYSGMPQVGGVLTVQIGEGCRISGRSSLFGRSAARQTPLLRVGRNVDIGWQNTIAVGTKVILGDHVRLAGNVYLAGFPGHPVDAAARARGEPETDEQVGDIILEDNVWLATGVTVLAGVRIGRNSIIGAGSVVTKDIPANVIAAGSPAKVIRVLEAEVL
jgi:acetyltransferase-like isoleucine patch superfamily enzyme